VTLVSTLLAHGCPLQAIVVALGCDERPVADWVARTGLQGQAVQESLVEQPRDLGQGQADESGVKKPGGVVWRALAMMVRPRLWLAGAVSEHRAMPLSRCWIERVPAWALPRALLVCTDGLCTDVRAVRETFRDAVPTGKRGCPRLHMWSQLCSAPVVKRYAKRRGGDVERRLVQGPPAQVEALRHRAQGDGVINTADIERLHTTCRERLASLTRRGRALARPRCPLRHGMSLLGTVYHFGTPHASWPLTKTETGRAGVLQTPAMAAGITAHGWSVQALLSLRGPPPRWTPPARRGRRGQALQRLMMRWCL
jgi:hypothetical protein